MGNREIFATPGMQWVSCGSGIEHAEGGATPKGETTAGFQIWINVPPGRKMEEPRYGTNPPSDIPCVPCGVSKDNGNMSDAASVRVLAGEAFGKRGPFATGHAKVTMLDFELLPGGITELELEAVSFARGESKPPVQEMSAKTHSLRLLPT